jgi:hypothetical protein
MFRLVSLTRADQKPTYRMFTIFKGAMKTLSRKLFISMDQYQSVNFSKIFQWCNSIIKYIFPIVLTSTYFNGYRGGILNVDNCPYNPSHQHAVLIVGYGVDGNTKWPYWIIKNSWGSGFGYGGQVFFNDFPFKFNLISNLLLQLHLHLSREKRLPIGQLAGNRNSSVKLQRINYLIFLWSHLYY